MKRFLLLLAVLAAGLVVPATANATAWGLREAYPPIEGINNVHGVYVHVSADGTWSQGAHSDGYQQAQLFVGSASGGNFLQIAIDKEGPNSPGADDCGLPPGNVRSIFVEWANAGSYHCHWFGAVNAGEDHLFRITTGPACSTNTQAWCAYADGVQLGNPHDINITAAGRAYIGLEQFYKDTTANGMADFKDLSVTGAGDGNQSGTWKSVGNVETCRYNDQDAYLVPTILTDGTWSTFSNSSGGAASTC